MTKRDHRAAVGIREFDLEGGQFIDKNFAGRT